MRRIALTALIGLILQVFAAFGSTVSMPVQAAGLATDAPPATLVDPRPCHEVAPASTTASEEGNVGSSGTCLDCCLLGTCCAMLPAATLAKDVRIACSLRREISTSLPAVAHGHPRFRPPILTRL